MAVERDDRPGAELAESQRADRLEHAFGQEIAQSTSLNIRGSALGGFAVLALLLSALFATAWLDDGKWRLGSGAETAIRWSFLAGSIAFAACVLLSVFATTPRGSWRREQHERIEGLAAGRTEAAALVEMIRKQRDRNDSKTRAVRWASILMAAGVIAAAVQGLGFALGADLQDTRPAGSEVHIPGAPADTGLTPEQTNAIVRQYAPVVWLHPRDRFLPMDPDAFLEGSRLTWRTRLGRNIEVVPRGRIDARRLGRTCGGARSGCYSYGGYVTGELTRPHQRGDRPAQLPGNRGFALDLADDLRRGSGTGAPFLYEVGTRRFDGEMRITYWFVYGWSTPFVPVPTSESRNLAPFAHEGDWESIDVVLGLDDKRPRRVEYYGHQGSHAVEWQTVTREGGTHPVVYSARNSHASYPTAAPRVGADTATCRRTLGIRLCSYDVRDAGPRWAPWEDGGGLRDARAQPWYGFGGAWGRAGDGSDATGPLGPSFWKRPND